MKRVTLVAVFTLLSIGTAVDAMAGAGFTFVNCCNRSISIDFHTDTIWCKDYHSGAIPAGGSWSCSTNCFDLSSYTISSAGVESYGDRYRKGSISFRPGTIYVNCERHYAGDRPHITPGDRCEKEDY